MEVMSPPGTVIGTVVQEWSILYPNFKVLNAAGETVLRIEGPLCTFSLCGDVEFKVNKYIITNFSLLNIFCLCLNQG